MFLFFLSLVGRLERLIAEVEHERVRVEHDSVVARREQVGDVSGGLHATELQEALGLSHGLTDEFCGPGFTLRLDDGGLLFLNTV